MIVRYNADFNEIRNNEINSKFSAETTTVTRFPGSVTSSNPDFNLITQGGFSGSAILITETEFPEPTVFTAIVNGALYQFTSAQSLQLNEDFSGDNLIEGNTITHSAGAMDTAILFTSSLRTNLRNNSIRTYEPIRFAMRDGLIDSRIFPGTCSLDSNRLCVGNGDCFIANFDSVSKGTCVGSNRPPDLLWRTLGIVMEGNTIEGPFMVAGIGLSGENMVTQGNRITGPSGDPLAAGILMSGKFSLETATVTRNIVANVPNAIRLNRRFPLGNFPPASAFHAEVHLNDLWGYEVAIRTSAGYDLPSDLNGNYWGLTCAEGGFNSDLVVDVSGQTIENVGAGHPYGVSVAETPDQSLPSTCF